jgi:hypothetical protein
LSKAWHAPCASDALAIKAETLGVKLYMSARQPWARRERVFAPLSGELTDALFPM